MHFKILFTCLCSSILLSACTQNPSKKLAMANPASQYCVEQGGKLRKLKDAFGNISYNCKLPNGVEKNEWDLYRETRELNNSAQP